MPQFKTEATTIGSVSNYVIIPLSLPPDGKLLYRNKSLSNANFYYETSIAIDFDISGEKIDNLIASLDFVNLSGEIVIQKNIKLNSPAVVKTPLETPNFNYKGTFFVNRFDVPLEEKQHYKHFCYFLAVKNNATRYYTLEKGTVVFTDVSCCNQ